MNFSTGIIAAGAIGGLIKSLVEQQGRIMLPGIEEKIEPATTKTIKYVNLGFIAALGTGAVAGIFFASSPESAFTAGISSVFLLEKAIEARPGLIGQ